MDPISPAQFARTEEMLVAALLAAVNQTPFGAYYPDADVTIRWRKGHVLPQIDLDRKPRVPAPMPKG